MTHLRTQWCILILYSHLLAAPFDRSLPYVVSSLYHCMQVSPSFGPLVLGPFVSSAPWCQPTCLVAYCEGQRCYPRTKDVQLYTFWDAFANLWRCTFSFVMSVRPPPWNNSAPTGLIFMKFVIWVFFENLSRKIQVSLKSDTNNGTLHEDRCTFMTISRSVLLTVRNVSDKSCRENQNTHFFC